MMNVDYDCQECGRFIERVQAGRYRMFVACPKCGRRSTTRRTLRKHGDDSPPTIRGDIRRDYFSDNLNRYVGSKREVREAQKQMEQDGFVPMTMQDCKSSVENTHKRMSECESDMKWYNREVEAGRGVDTAFGSEPE